MAGFARLFATAFIAAVLAPLPALACADARYLWEEQGLSLEELRGGVDFAPDEALARLALGAQLLRQGDWPEALYHLELAAAWEPNCAAAQLFYAYALNERANHRPGSESELSEQEFAPIAPANTREQRVLLLAVDRRFDRVAEMESLDPFTHRLRADALLRRDFVNFKEVPADGPTRAMESYRQAIALDPTDYQLTTMLVALLVGASAWLHGPACDEDFVRDILTATDQDETVTRDLAAAAPCFSEAANLLAGLYEAALSGSLDPKKDAIADAQKISLIWFGSLIVAERRDEAIGVCRQVIKRFPEGDLAEEAIKAPGLTFEQAKASGDLGFLSDIPSMERDAYEALADCAGT
jgi:tetratricopeptide (TPR) repeat protein